MAGARAALLPLLLHLGNLALAARGESGRPGCAPTSDSAQQIVGPGQTTSPAQPGLRVSPAGLGALSLSSPSVDEQGGGRTARRVAELGPGPSSAVPAKGS